VIEFYTPAKKSRFAIETQRGSWATLLRTVCDLDAEGRAVFVTEHLACLRLIYTIVLYYFYLIVSRWDLVPPAWLSR
jgi:hypothetical protein